MPEAIYTTTEPKPDPEYGVYCDGELIKMFPNPNDAIKLATSMDSSCIKKNIHIVLPVESELKWVFADEWR